MVSLKERMDKAAERQEAQKAELYRPDGTKFYSDEEHDEREVAIRREFVATMDLIEGDIDRGIAAAEEEILKAEHADPTDALTTEELERANAKRNFVSDECWMLSLPKLEQRCRAVLSAGDRVNIFLYAHHAAQRAGEPPRYDRNDPAVQDEEGAPEVREVVAELRQRLDPEREGKLGRAREGLGELREAERYAYLRRRGAKSPAELSRKRRLETWRRSAQG